MSSQDQTATGAASTPLLTLRGLRADRGERAVLRGVDLDVHRGEILGLLGPNGAGKSTLFHLLNGLIPWASGRVELEGRPFDARQRSFRARCGVVFQEPALDPQLTGRENLMLAGRLYGLPRSQTRTRAQALLERAGLADRADEAVARYSGGMRRRVELARALIHEPSILVLDEPTSGLDEGAFRTVWAELHAWRRERELTLVFTTHRPEEAEQADRLAILDGGRIVACDTPDRLRARVRGDLIVIEAADASATAATLAERFGVEARVIDGRIALRSEQAHELIPRIVRELPVSALRSIGMRRTGLGEVFLELTGHELSETAP